jgi:uncharacterized membrane protein
MTRGGEAKQGAADKYVLAAIVLAIIVHLAAVIFVPRQRVSAAIDALSAGGMQFNHWQTMERLKEPVAGAPFPNTDVMSAACVFDVSPGPVLVTLAPWDSYWSLVFYNDQGEPFETIADREAQSTRFVLVRAGQSAPRRETNVIETPSARGMIVLRRLAPSASRYAEAASAARNDVCGNLQALSR